MRLSIIIPTKNLRNDNLDRCLQSINNHTTSCEVILVTEGEGMNAKMNAGVSKAEGDYFVFLHDDCEVTPGWADVLAPVGGFKVGEQGDKFDTYGGFYTPEERYAKDDENPQYTAFFAVSREAHTQIGPFDENYKEPGYQDVDWGLSVAKAGLAIERLPGKIIHWHSPIRRVMSEENRTYLRKKWGLDAH